MLVNAQAERCFGYTRDELVGRSIEDLIPPRFRNLHLDFRKLFLQAPQTRAMGAGRELFGLRKDGSEFPVEIGLNPLQTPTGVAVISSVVDITERKKLEERFRLVVEASPSAIVVANAHGLIELVNSQTELLFGYARHELLGQPVEMLIPQRLKGHHPAFRADYLQSPQTRPMGSGRDLYGLRKDGSEFPVEIGLNPIATEDGPLVLSSIIDITARKAAETRLKQQAEEISKASRYKSEFMAKMSHELRTPLNSILILSEQLAADPDQRLSEKQCEYAQTIYRSGSDLLALINDILDLSRIEAGGVLLTQSSFPLTDLVTGLQQTFTPQAEKKKLEFSITLDPALPVSMTGDFQRIFQILKNLVANAVKFTPGGSVVVYFSLKQLEQDESEPYLLITVEDTGPGISQDKQALIFDAFQQVDSAINRQHSGTGLGLTISRQLAALLGGTITLKSELGHGSTFSLSLPLHAVATNTPPESIFNVSQAHPIEVGQSDHVGPSRLSGAGKTVLVVDDDIRSIFALCSLLEEHGFEVISAQNGAEAVSLFTRNEHFDVVLMDMVMPRLDGYEATQQLRALACTKPVLALTACAMPGDREKCILAGADDYLAKPVGHRELLPKLAQWLNLDGLQHEPQ